MNTLFDHSTAADVARLTMIDGQPYLFDSEFIAFVPYGEPAAVRWAAKKYLGAGTLYGAPLWRGAKLQGSRRNTIQVGLNLRQAVFLANRAALRFDKSMAIARIEAAFKVAMTRVDQSAEAPAPAPAIPANVDSRLLAVVEAIQGETAAIAAMMTERETLAGRIREAEERRDALAAKLPPFLKLVAGPSPAP